MSPDGVLPSGSWGGDHVSLVVEPSRADVEFDCAHGSLTVPISLAPGGRFSVTGVFVRERGGPVREDDPSDRHSAQYSGAVDAGRMTLSVTVPDLPSAGARYELVRGATPRLFKCL
jgi:hypothetical protein